MQEENTGRYCEECARREATQRCAGRWLCDACTQEVEQFMRDEQARIALEADI